VPGVQCIRALWSPTLAACQLAAGPSNTRASWVVPALCVLYCDLLPEWPAGAQGWVTTAAQHRHGNLYFSSAAYPQRRSISAKKYVGYAGSCCCRNICDSLCATAATQHWTNYGVWHAALAPLCLKCSAVPRCSCTSTQRRMIRS
jgi:hypothetical protein